ncbi:MAG: VWA domain-containing protein [Acidobacteriota bacterium]|nr:VWA domain-containing protein [Acidobacteriota bacterium]
MSQPHSVAATWKMTRNWRRRWSLKTLLLIVGLVWSGVSAGSALAQEAEQIPADEPMDTFGELIEVRLVEVEVVVTDAQGQRVPGLQAEDFELLVDGALEPVEYFSEVQDNQRVQATGGQNDAFEKLVVEPAEALGEQVAQDIAREPVHSWLVFIDDYYTDRRYRKALFERLLRDLETLRPGDRMAVVRYAGHKLEVLSPWTRSKTELRRVIQNAQDLKPGDQRRLAQLRAVSTTGAYFEERARLNSQQVSKVVNAASITLRSFAEAEGRKLFVLVSSGWPYDFAGGPVPERSLFGDRLQRTNLERIHQVADVANLVGYTIYPLHLGLAGSPVDAANSQGRGGSSLDVGSLTERDSLRYLAHETGGEMMTYAIAKPTLPVQWLREETRSYYVLGFSPRIVRDGRKHSVEVRVRGQGLEARHRSGYRDLTQRTQASMATEAALLFDAPTKNTLDVAFGQAKKLRLGPARVPMTVRIPMDWVTMVNFDGYHHASLRLRVAVVDKRGNRSDIAVVPVRFKGEKPAPGEVAVYETEVELRRQKQTLAVSLVDTLSNEMLTSKVELDL